jgi:hypothetical protein
VNWTDPRGGELATAGRVAHRLTDDQMAKSRSDESMHQSTRGRSLRHSRRLLAVGGAGLAVVVVVSAIAVASRGDSQGEKRPTAAGPEGAGVAPESSPTAEPSPTVDPVAEIEATAPSGVWRATTIVSRIKLRGGGSEKEAPGKPTRWTFQPDDCTVDGCTGSISSSSGNVYQYTWSDGTLTLERKVHRDPKSACVDTVTGEVKPIEESAWQGTYRYVYSPFTVAGDQLSTNAHWKVTDERFFGTCEPQDNDYVGGRFTLKIQRLNK